jgi:hypothetical protein
VIIKTTLNQDESFGNYSKNRRTVYKLPKRQSSNQDSEKEPPEAETEKEEKQN